MGEELKDRFGKLPHPVKRLLDVSDLKLEAAVWQIHTITMQDKYLVFKFNDRTRITQLASQRKVLRIVDDETAMVTLTESKIAPGKLISLVKSLLQPPS